VTPSQLRAFACVVRLGSVKAAAERVRGVAWSLGPSAAEVRFAVAGDLAAELLRFITTPRATQAMVRGAGVHVGGFRPAVYVTLWS
jgi:hypothetical protein